MHRDDGIVYVDITMRAGWTDEQKRALYAMLAELAGEYANTEPCNMFITIHENQLADWSFGNGVAQYLERNQVVRYLGVTNQPGVVHLTFQRLEGAQSSP